MAAHATRVLRAPTRRSTYGLLIASGTSILVAGLLLPFLVADPIGDQALSAGGFTPGSRSGPVDVEQVTTTTATTTAPPSTDTGSGPGAVDGTGGPAADDPEAAPAAVERLASDMGITPDTITVGIPVPDTSSFGDTDGGVKFGETIGDIRLQYQAALDELNARGGIHGRQVIAEYRLYEVANLDAMRAACIYLTEEKKVFAVLGGFYGDPILCVTEQHRTPMLAQASEPDDFYARSQGMYFSLAASKDRILADLVTALDRDGHLSGRTIGILDQEGIDAIPVDRTLIPRLEALGYEVAYHARIANDTGAAQSQIPLEVQRMQGADVDTVIIASGLIRATVFVQEAENQRWAPRYLLSDFASGATDIYTVAMPESFDGSVAYTSFRTGEARAGQPEAGHDRACRELYETGTGEALDRTTIEYYYAVSACGIVSLFERGMTGAGVNPTRVTLSEALQGLGRFDVPYGATGSFGPGKFDAPDATRQVGWQHACTCWQPVDEFRPT